MKKFIQKKWIRLMSSSNIMKINYFYHKLFGEKDLGNIGFNFTDKPSRAKVVQDIIDIKKYKSYLEIGTFKDELFNEIICEKKVGVDPFSGGTVRKTSDEFFSTNNQKFDCIYIDVSFSDARSGFLSSRLRACSPSPAPASGRA